MTVRSGGILVVLTGGTIGSTCSDGVRGIEGDSPYVLIREFRKKYQEYNDCEFEVINPYSILSENLTCELWSLLYSALNEADTAGYDGIIITHGSDTLAYTSAAIGMLMRHTGCPIVLTAADRPPDDPKSNALPNFRASVDFILNSAWNRLRGVFVSYRRNSDGAQVFYIATRLCSADCYSDEFSSYGGSCFGRMLNGEFVPVLSPLNPPVRSMCGGSDELKPIAGKNTDFGAKKILLLRSYPGMDYSVINPGGYAAVINYGYHCATAYTAYSEGKSSSLPKFAEMCRECGVDLWLGSFKSFESDIYSTQTEMESAGIKKFYDMSPEAAYVKAVLAYNLPSADPEFFIKRCIYYEMVGHELND